MKLAKLSLAAIMAVGALATTSSAANLEDAIKGVSFSGFARYRLNDDRDGNPQATHASDNDTDIRLTATSKVTDMISFTGDVGIRSNNDNGSGSTTLGQLDLAQAYFTYSQNALTVKAGKQNTATPVTDNGWMGNYGNGVVAMYNVGQVTLAAVYYGNTNALAQEDISGVAAIGSFGVVNAQVWYINTEDTVDRMYFTQVDGKVGPVSLTGQYINTKLKGVSGTGSFYGIKAGYAMDNFAINAGYSQNDDKQGVYALSPDASPVFAGWRLGYLIDNEPDAQAMYVDAGATFGKFGVKVGYAKASYDTATLNDTDAQEIWGQVSYKVAKNFNTYAKYSDQNADVNANDQKYFRFEAKYSF